MTSSSFAGKSLVELDCTQQNPLVNLSRKIVNGNASDDFDETWNQFLTSNLRPRDLHDEYLANLAMSTEAPKTSNLYELADQIAENSAEKLAEKWAEEYTAEQANSLSEQWAEEFSYLNLRDQKTENANENKDISEMWATEFLDKFDQTSRSTEEYLSEATNRTNSAAEGKTEAEELIARRKIFDVSETYIFHSNNPYVQETDAFEKGQKAVSDGHLADAILYLEAAVQQNRENSDGWFLLGKCQTENENDKQAIAAYTTALRLQQPQQKETQLALAVAYINESMEAEALEVLEQWITSYQSTVAVPVKPNAAASDPIDDLVVQAEKVEQLIQKVLAKREIVTDESVLHNALSLVYNIKGDFDRAAEEVKYAIVSNPKDYVLWNRFGATLANGKRPAEAVAAYREALAICPNYTRAHYNLGIAHFHLQNYREAIEHFITALKLQQNCGSVSSSSIWSSLRAAILRQDYPLSMDLLTAVNMHDLENCIKFIK